MTHNQSSYQCIFTIFSLNGSKSVVSNVGTMTVVGKGISTHIYVAKTTNDLINYH